MRIPVLLFTLFAFALAACGRPAPPNRPMAPVTLTAPRFGDDKPVDWPGRTPRAYAVHGIDVARYQTRIDWPVAQASGVSFAFIKATEGGDHLDPMFNQHWNAARRAGVPRGAYHFWFHCRSAEEQAAWFIANVPRESGTLPPVLDMEWTRSRNCPKRPPAAHNRAEAQRFLDILTRHYGQRPIIYTTVDYYRDNDMGRIRGHEFWLRSVADHPSTVYPGQPWRFWQYTGTGRIPGIEGPVDINVFRGSPRDWAEWLTARRR
jgi:lysozyme